MPIAILAAAALAAMQPQPARAPDRPPLAGPTVAPAVERNTLVSYDLNGRLRPLDVSPDLAAIELLNLSPELRAHVDAVIAARAEAMDQFVTSNLMLLSQLDTASKAGDKLDQAALLMES